MRLKAKRPNNNECAPPLPPPTQELLRPQKDNAEPPAPSTPPSWQVGRRNSAPPMPLSPELFTPDIYGNESEDKPFCPRLKSCVKAHQLLESKTSAPVPEPITPARAWRQQLESILIRGPISRPVASALITADDMSSDDSTEHSESEGGEVFDVLRPVSPATAVQFRLNEQAVESPRRARSEGRSLRERLRLRRKKTGFMFNPNAGDGEKQDVAASYQKGVEEFKKRDILNLKAKFGSWKRKGSITAQSDYAQSTTPSQ